ncbi:MAG: histidine--tRNA ligase [Deltaproteobacteria bacterium RIFCSPLOWO2_02_FULL_47_10]|nr:MAG: histidine--tRNA ligase [Deltaproteobacteria bacterium RIFCSPLOWO2_02_FULL_47_10]
MKYTSIKGMSDIMPDKMPLWHKLEETVLSVFGAYGYSEIRTPIVEKTELFVRGIGENTAVVEKEMYTFKDLSDDMLSLRPEGTASVVRAYIENNVYQNDPVAKYLYIGHMFRRERPQKGRYRQFYQIGVEAIGIVDAAIDAEQIAMADFFFKKLGLKDFSIEINSLGCKACRPGFDKVFAGFLKEKRVHLCGDCQRRIENNPLRALDCKNPGCIEAMKQAPTIGSHLCKECETHFLAVQMILNRLGTKFVVNHKVVRGLDYYMRTAFEFTTTKLGAQNAFLGGGRYDGLVKDLGGPAVSGVGFAIGMERVILLMELEGSASAERSDIIFFAVLGETARENSLSIINMLRQDGINIEWDPDGHSLKSQMRRADKLAAHTVVIIGDDEIKKGAAVVRNMHTKEQSEVKLADLARHFVRVEG